MLSSTPYSSPSISNCIGRRGGSGSFTPAGDRCSLWAFLLCFTPPRQPRLVLFRGTSKGREEDGGSLCVIVTSFPNAAWAIDRPECFFSIVCFSFFFLGSAGAAIAGAGVGGILSRHAELASRSLFFSFFSRSSTPLMKLLHLVPSPSSMKNKK